MAEQGIEPFTRRGFMRMAAGAAVAAAVGGCRSASDKSKATAATKPGAGAAPAPVLRIAQLSHFVPAYDQWFDEDYTKRWAQRTGIEVVVDHFPLEQLSTWAQAEVATQQGHDLFFFVTPAAAFEDDVIDHREVVEEVEAKVGKMVPLVERSVFNPKTKKWFGFSDAWSPGPVHYRSDVWGPIGINPDSWDAVLRGAPKVTTSGHPVGLGISRDFDSSVTLLSLLHAYGSSVQDEAGNVAINRPETVEALKLMTSIYRAGMTEDVFTWDASANNRFLAGGRGSLIVNAVSALRAIETQDEALASRVQLLPTPAGPAGRFGVYITGTYVIWKFARNQEAAKQFLVDLAVDYRDAFEKSGFYNLPSFPGAVPDVGGLVAQDPKYAMLADAASWSTNLGHPGYASAAIDEALNQFIVPDMFAAAARETLSAEDAAQRAEAQLQPIFDRWRERGKV
jgi:multiple sugar transport system substrate-binding protein